jgi:mono/diheme cytochrome c family protein
MNLVILTLAVALAGTVSAERAGAADFDPAAHDIDRGKKVFERIGNCLQCHGWDGAGMGRNPRSVGTAPNLRVFEPDPDILRELIACGRPYTMMPFHDRLAYSDDRCYGLTMDDFPDGEKPHRGKSVRPGDIDNLIAYLLTQVIGKGKTTLEECEAFYKPGHRNCAALAKKD